MNNTNSITQEKLKEVLDYNPNTGIFTWKKNNKIAGSKYKTGYIRIEINKKKYMAHRLAWIYVYGESQNKVTDHINGTKNDNRICNLREASVSENLYNVKKSNKNKTGIKNVFWYKSRSKWNVIIRINNKRKNLGYFDDFEFAELLAIEARNKYHGKFANHF